MAEPIFDIRPQERRRAALAFACLLLLVASYTVVKSVRDAIFLSSFGITELSLFSIGLAIGMGFVISFYIRVTRGVPRHVLIGGTNTFIAASLALIWLALVSGRLESTIPWMLYVWSRIFGVFIVMQFWLLANDLFDAREAKRLFGFIGAGAIIGGIIGGIASRQLARSIGSEDLLLMAGGALVVEAALVFLVWPHRRQREPERRAPPQRAAVKQTPPVGYDVLKQDRLVRSLALALLLSTVATTLLDWQLKGVARAAFADRTDAMASFFGSLHAYISGAALFIQAFLTARILRRFGVAMGLLSLPVTILVVSTLALGHGLIPWLTLLGAVSATKVADGGLRFAIDKASMELLWLPVPTATKDEGKPFVDTVMDRFGTGLTGLTWLLLAAAGLDTAARLHLVSAVIAGICAIWIVFVIKARQAYVAALRASLAGRELSLGDLRLDRVGVEASRSVTAALESDDPREVLFGLYLVEESRGTTPALHAPLRHPDPRVRTQTLRLLARRADDGYRQDAAQLVVDPEPRVREAAIIYLGSSAPAERDSVVDELRERADVPPEVAPLVRLWRAPATGDALQRLQQLLHQSEGQRRLSVIRSLSAAPPAVAAELLAPLLDCEDRETTLAALVAAGRAGAVGVAGEVAQLLCRPRLRRLATDALHRMGPGAMDALLPLLRDGSASASARRIAARFVGSFGRLELAPDLLTLLRTPQRDLSGQALRALNRLRSRFGLTLRADEWQLVDPILQGEIRESYRELLFLGAAAWPDRRRARPPSDVLEIVIAQRVDQRMERVFRMLGLRYDPGDLHAAYRGTDGDSRARRASAIELLDNTLEHEHAHLLLPLLESSEPERLSAAARDLFKLEPETRPQLLRRLLGGPDELLRATAGWSSGRERRGALLPELQRLSTEPDWAGEAARQAARRIEAKDSEEGAVALTAIDKALTLQRVDVLERATIEDLAYVAQIATEERHEPGATIYEEGEFSDALFVVVDGRVKLHRQQMEIAMLTKGEAFGSWALLDEAPRLATATAIEPTTLLRVSREEFIEVLADRVDIVQAVFKAMVDRLRRLASTARDL